jgi:hypothetical protein
MKLPESLTQEIGEGDQSLQKITPGRQLKR